MYDWHVLARPLGCLWVPRLQTLSEGVDFSFLGMCLQPLLSGGGTTFAEQIALSSAAAASASM